MAFANVENSPRLQATLSALRRAPNGLTGLQLCMDARVMNPGEVCSELRKQGFEISCTEQAPSGSGRRVFLYKLVAEPL